MELRLGGPEDAPGIRAIYAPIVAETATSFEVDVPSDEELGSRVAGRWPAHPWLVAEDDGTILGYAYGGPFKGRAAYDWSTEVSLYVHPDARRTGLGRRLYAALFALLRTQGYAQAYAGITLPNDASVGIHEALGFVPVGVYRNVGWKFGAWHDVGWWQLSLRPAAEAGAPPHPVRPLDALTPAEVAAALAPRAAAR